MAVDPFVELAEPGPGNIGDASHADVILQTEANTALQHWLQDHPEVGGELYATLQTKHDVAGHRIFGCVIGSALAVGFELTSGHSLGIVRRARRDAATAWIAQGLAGQKLQRHIGALWQMLLPGRSARPRRPALTGRGGQSPSGSQSVSCSPCRD